MMLCRLLAMQRSCCRRLAAAWPHPKISGLLSYLRAPITDCFSMSLAWHSSASQWPNIRKQWQSIPSCGADVFSNIITGFFLTHETISEREGQVPKHPMR